ncbi:MAG: MFS transporter [Alphaproteobacteria bacterium]|nr:MFS transporter [Alphaproteobacteria bacterium]
MPLRNRSTLTVAALGITQTLAWGSSYYLPAILADPIAAALGVPKSLFFGFFSASLLLQAALGPAIGKAIDRRGERSVLVLSNFVLAAGLVELALTQRSVGLAAAWAVLGIGMALGLYDAGFATLTALYGREARGPITGITLIGGFASTVGWPLSALLNDHFGWRGACLGWAALNIFVCLPINRLLIPLPAPSAPAAVPETTAPPPANGMAVLAFVFGAAGFATGAMAAHLPRLLEMSGATATAAIFAASLMGPAQVAARLFEFGVLKRRHPLVSTRLALMMHPLGAAVLGVVGAPAAAAFALLHGAGNGLLTISRGTLPLALFGPAGYGLRTGIIAAPARVTTAAAPLLFGLLLNAMGPAALVVSGGLSFAALASLALLRMRPAEAPS